MPPRQWHRYQPKRWRLLSASTIDRSGRRFIKGGEPAAASRKGRRTSLPGRLSCRGFLLFVFVWFWRLWRLGAMFFGGLGGGRFFCGKRRGWAEGDEAGEAQSRCQEKFTHGNPPRVTLLKFAPCKRSTREAADYSACSSQSRDLFRASSQRWRR